MTKEEKNKIDQVFEMTIRIDERTEVLVKKQEADDERWKEYEPILKALPKVVEKVEAHEKAYERGKATSWLLGGLTAIALGILGGWEWIKKLF